MISIVSAYYNRKQLFHETLKTIKKSVIKDIEFIVVDDGSDPAHRLEPFVSEFPFLKIIRLEKENKWYTNPCIPFNIGIRASKGDIIVLQNPECLHVHDVLSYIIENLNDTNYISISAYGLDPNLTKKIPFHRINKSMIEFFNNLPQQPYVGGMSLGWYDHPKYRAVYFHFCSAVTRNNMGKLNGFDERFATGIAYDDDELIYRIKLLGLQPIITTQVSVIHQYHAPVSEYPGSAELCEKNRTILQTMTRVENNPYANKYQPLWK